MSEAELAESDDADERLLTRLGLRGTRLPELQKDEPHPTAKPRRPGKRGPGRDSTGGADGEEVTIPSDEEQAAG